MNMFANLFLKDEQRCFAFLDKWDYYTRFTRGLESSEKNFYIYFNQNIRY